MKVGKLSTSQVAGLERVKDSLMNSVAMLQELCEELRCPGVPGDVVTPKTLRGVRSSVRRRIATAERHLAEV